MLTKGNLQQLLAACLSVACVVIPYFLPDGPLPYYPYTIPAGLVAFVLARVAQAKRLAIFALVAAFSPLLAFVLTYAVMFLLHVVSFGHLPPDSWL